MISLILAESSLEIVPVQLQDHPSVVRHAQRLGRLPVQTLLDNSWHYAAMKGITNEMKRGRPDIVHFSLLEATSIPLYYQNELSVYVHTIHNKVIKLGQNVRIPKSYHRFEGLITKLYRTRVTDDIELLRLYDQTLSELLDTINPSKVIGLSTLGSRQSCSDIANQISDDCCIIIGGFQKGHFTKTTTSQVDDMYSINEHSLESHIVTARILYEYEKTIFM